MIERSAIERESWWRRWSEEVSVVEVELKLALGAGKLFCQYRLIPAHTHTHTQTETERCRYSCIGIIQQPRKQVVWFVCV